MKKPNKYIKGKMGYMLDLRGAMGRLNEASREWCRAFDVGDEKALVSLGDIYNEAIADINMTSSCLNKFDE